MMEDWEEDDDILLGFGSFLNPLPLSRRGIRRSRRNLGSSSLHDFMSNSLLVQLLYGSGDENNDDDDFEDMHSDISRVTPRNAMPLLNLCARAVAKYCPCALLEEHQPPLDEALLRKVAFWAFPQDEKQVKAFANLTDKCNFWERGGSLVRDKRVREMWQVGFMATAYISKYATNAALSSTSSQESATNSDIRVSLTFEQQKIMSSTCSECKNEVWCSHIIAAIIFRIKNPSQVRVHAPMTETLSTLDRNQLQKLLQYAINEDPAGILGKVFKHVDAVRDSSSEISVVAGAPDPTFGRQQDAVSQWQLSLDWLQKNLIEELEEMTRQRIFEYTAPSAYYPDSYDWSEKIESRMYSYMGKVLDLARQGECVCAAEVLIRIMSTVLQRMSLVSRFDCPCLTRFGHDMIHMLTILILDPNSNRVARRMLSAAIRRFSCKFNIQQEHSIAYSEWAELPSIQSQYQDQIQQPTNNRLFVEPLCAELLPPWPQSLTDLIEGKSSSYDEDIVLMLIRLEILFHLEKSEAFHKIGRLCVKIIIKLARMASKLSVLNELMDEDGDIINHLNGNHKKEDGTAAPSKESSGTNCKELRTKSLRKKKKVPTATLR